MKFGDTAAQGIAKSLQSLQQKFAAVMSSVSNKWTRKQKMIFLSLVCVGFISSSISAIMQSFNEEKFSAPQQIVIPKEQRNEDIPLITEKEFQRVQSFRQRLDSVTIKQRPGLIDSIRMVEQMYYSQQK